MMIAAKVYSATGMALLSAAEQTWMSCCHTWVVTTLLTDPAQWMSALSRGSRLSRPWSRGGAPQPVSTTSTLFRLSSSSWSRSSTRTGSVVGNSSRSRASRVRSNCWSKVVAFIRARAVIESPVLGREERHVCRLWSVHTARTTAELAGQTREVGEQPGDGEPHLRALQSGRRGRQSHGARVRRLKAEAVPLDPARKHGHQQLTGHGDDVVGAVAGVAGEPQGVRDVENVAGVVLFGPEVPGVASMREHGVDDPFGPRKRHVELGERAA